MGSTLRGKNLLKEKTTERKLKGKKSRITSSEIISVHLYIKYLGSG